MKLNKNTTGTDYVVSDIHGCFDELMSQLSNVNFDKTKDRLFIVGDLIDRGTQNLECLSLLKEDWVYATMGNHEYMFLNFLKGIDTDLFLYNGGNWALEVEFSILYEYKSIIKNLPLMIETQVGDSSIGFVHANIYDWTYSKSLLKNSTNPFKSHSDHAMSLIWSRRRIYNRDPSVTAGIDKVFLGHTPQDSILTLSNNIYIDTGAVFKNGKLSLLKVSDYV